MSFNSPPSLASPSTLSKPFITFSTPKLFQVTFFVPKTWFFPHLSSVSCWRRSSERQRSRRWWFYPTKWSWPSRNPSLTQRDNGRTSIASLGFFPQRSLKLVVLEAFWHKLCLLFFIWFLYGHTGFLVNLSLITEVTSLLPSFLKNITAQKDWGQG